MIGRHCGRSARFGHPDCAGRAIVENSAIVGRISFRFTKPSISFRETFRFVHEQMIPCCFVSCKPRTFISCRLNPGISPFFYPLMNSELLMCLFDAFLLQRTCKGCPAVPCCCMCVSLITSDINKVSNKSGNRASIQAKWYLIEISVELIVTGTYNQDTRWEMTTSNRL